MYTYVGREKKYGAVYTKKSCLFSVNCPKFCYIEQHRYRIKKHLKETKIQERNNLKNSFRNSVSSSIKGLFMAPSNFNESVARFIELVGIFPRYYS